MYKKLGYATLGLLFLGGSALADDMGDDHPGAALYEDKCANCHFEDDFSGESADAIAGMIKDINAGTTEHPAKFDGLSDDDVKMLAEYFASQ